VLDLDGDGAVGDPWSLALFAALAGAVDSWWALVFPVLPLVAAGIVRPQGSGDTPPEVGLLFTLPVALAAVAVAVAPRRR
jgi:hypothetical protein